MEKYIKRLREIESDVFNNINIASQKTINIVQDTVIELEKDFDELPVNRFDLGAISYDIDIMLEVWNKDLEYDIETLKKLNEVLSDWYKEIIPQ